jgi:hypothetical protein
MKTIEALKRESSLVEGIGSDWMPNVLPSEGAFVTVHADCMYKRLVRCERRCTDFDRGSNQVFVLGQERSGLL